MEVERMTAGLSSSIGKEVTANDLLKQARDFIFHHVATHVSQMGIQTNQVVLVCTFTCFFALADEKREFFKQRTVTFKEAADIVETVSKVLDVVLPPEKRVSFRQVREEIEDLLKHQTTGEKEAVNMKLMKETSPQQLYELFIKNIQQ